MEWLKKMADDASASLLTAKAWTGGVADRGYGSFVSGLRVVVQENRRLEDEGTPLRAMFRSARLKANELIEVSYGAYVDARARSQEAMAAIGRRTTFLAEAAAKADDTRRHKPEILVGSLTAAAAGLSLLSRKRLIVNTLSAALLSSTAVYGSLWVEQRYPPAGVKKDATTTTPSSSTD